MNEAEQEFLDSMLDELSITPRERLRRLLEEQFDEGWHSLRIEYETQAKNPSHPITDRNPWRSAR